MSSNRSIILFICFFAYFGYSFQTAKPTKWIISKSCSLKVAGSTNINKFNCAITNYYKPDTLTIYKASNTSAIRITGKMDLDVNNFDCHNPVMTADLRKTLKGKIYPHLTINFLSLNRYPDFKQKSGEIRGRVNIELAGVNKQFDVDYRFFTNGANALTLVGKRKINFSDFKIIPPRKLGGMIETNNELDIEFNLQLKVLN
ncbi:MAG TPA: YceI family protein [Pelobium sp.]|nr:YceI family protein [Pelobium sp.]